MLRIARAPGPAGRLARTVKLADLDDHLRAPAAARATRRTRAPSGGSRARAADATSPGATAVALGA